MSRPKKDPVEAAVNAYLALDTDSRKAFHRDVRLVENAVAFLNERTAGAPGHARRTRKPSGQQPDGTLVADKG